MAQTNRTTVWNSWADKVEEEEELNQSAGQVWNIAAPAAAKTGWKTLEEEKNFPTLGSSPLPKTKTPKSKTPAKKTPSLSTEAKKSTKRVSLPVEIVDTRPKPQTQSQPKSRSKRAQNSRSAGVWRERPFSSTPASTPEKETTPKWKASGMWTSKRTAGSSTASTPIATSTPVAIPTLTPEEKEEGWETVIPRPTPRANVGLPPRRPARAKGTVIGSLRREREEREQREKSEKRK